MQFQRTLGCEGIGAEGDPPLECCQQDACRPPLFLTKNIWPEEEEEDDVQQQEWG